MNNINVNISITDTPWDSTIFGVKTYEVNFTSNDNLEQSIKEVIKSKRYGHYTVKIDPLFSKDILHKFGFYYCDSLIEPFCLRKNFVDYFDKAISLSQNVGLDRIRDICNSAFSHGRFHRDFNIPKSLASERYIQWLQDLWDQNQVFTLMYHDEVAGFFAFSDSKILLHALEDSFRGKGLSKFFWSSACRELFKQQTLSELTSSISACNLPVLNLYISLGFKFRNPVDVYHWLYQE